MIVEIKTGGELWAMVTAEDMDYIEQSVVDCIITSKKLYPGEKIVISGLAEGRIEKLKKIAEKRLNQEKK